MLSRKRLSSNFCGFNNSENGKPLYFGKTFYILLRKGQFSQNSVFGPRTVVNYGKSFLQRSHLCICSEFSSEIRLFVEKILSFKKFLEIVLVYNGKRLN